MEYTEKRRTYLKRWRATRKALGIVAKNQQRLAEEAAVLEAKRANIIELSAAGFSVRSIAALLNTSTASVQRAKKHHAKETSEN